VLTGWRDQGLAIDVAMHIGSLAAVVIYFRTDVAALLGGLLDVARNRQSERRRLVLLIILATLPVVVAGSFLHDRIAGDWRNPLLIAVTTMLFGLVLWLADRRAGLAVGSVQSLSWRDAALIGLAQALALVPGVSRSGITMTVALFLGQTRPEAARFSLLLSIPTTVAAGVLGGFQIVRSGDTSLQMDAVIAGTLAFVSAMLAIAGLMAWLRRATFLPFVIYRLLLGGLLAVLIVAGVLPGL
jgi:undecaprenyl-diphosphatase